MNRWRCEYLTASYLEPMPEKAHDLERLTVKLFSNLEIFLHNRRYLNNATSFFREVDATDGCFEQLRATGGLEARSSVKHLRPDLFETVTLVKLLNTGGSLWHSPPDQTSALERITRRVLKNGSPLGRDENPAEN